MGDLVKYNGCLIIVHGWATTHGRMLGSYEVVADTAETAAAFAARGITRLYTSVDPPNGSAAEAGSLDRRYLVEMAKCEIDFILETDF